nr:MAG TPA: hypothetical protein [Caudoviricetes sp.]
MPVPPIKSISSNLPIHVRIMVQAFNRLVPLFRLTKEH